VCWHESAFIFSSSLQKEGHKLQYDEVSFVFAILIVCSFKRQIPVPYMMTMYYFLHVLLAGATSHFITQSDFFF
jgi:hypothetical protein